MTSDAAITREEYERRFKAHIIATLMAPGSTWTLQEATDAAENEFDSIEPDFLDDPEGDADEALSYWDADEDDV